MKHNDKMESLKDWEDTVEKKLTTHKSYAKEDFKYPMWFKHRQFKFIVEFTDLRHGIVILESIDTEIVKDFHSNTWTEHTNDSVWEQVPNPNLVTDTDNNKAKNPNSKHYELWENFEAIDVIKLALTDEEYKGFLKGNILKYQLRLGKKDDVSKEIEKIKDYQKELNK